MMKQIFSTLLIWLALAGVLIAHASAESVIICVLDSGCNLEGAEGWDFLSDSDDLSDPLGHGTRVYSLIRAGAEDAEIFMLKCFASEESFDEEAVARAIYAAVDIYHADVINMSWMVNGERPALYEAIRYAHESGAILLAPVGNLSFSTGLGTSTYPSAWEEVIGIGGVNLNDDAEPVSSLFYLANDSVFVCARADCDLEKGTSYASPRIAAVVAKWLLKEPNATDEDIRLMLKQAAQDIGEPGYDKTYGWGYVECGEPQMTSPGK